MANGVTLERALQAFLLQYRSTPYATIGLTPSMLMLGCDIQTRLNLFRPELLERVEGRQAQQTKYHNEHCKRWELAWARRCGLGTGEKAQLGPVSFLVELEDGEMWRRHIDHLRERLAKDPHESPFAEVDVIPSEQSEPPAETQSFKLTTSHALCHSMNIEITHYRIPSILVKQFHH